MKRKLITYLWTKLTILMIKQGRSSLWFLTEIEGLRWMTTGKSQRVNTIQLMNKALKKAHERILNKSKALDE